MNESWCPTSYRHEATEAVGRTLPYLCNSQLQVVVDLNELFLLDLKAIQSLIKFNLRKIISEVKFHDLAKYFIANKPFLSY